MIELLLVFVGFTTFIGHQEAVSNQTEISHIEVDYLVATTLHAIYEETQMNTNIDTSINSEYSNDVWNILTKCDSISRPIDLLECKYSIIYDLNNI